MPVMRAYIEDDWLLDFNKKGLHCRKGIFAGSRRRQFADSVSKTVEELLNSFFHLRFGWRRLSGWPLIRLAGGFSAEYTPNAKISGGQAT